MTTMYRLDLLNPVSGQWLPVPLPPARHFTTAILQGLRLYPDGASRVEQVEQVEVPDEDEPTPSVRRTTVDGQPVIATDGVTDEQIQAEIEARRRQRTRLEY